MPNGYFTPDEAKRELGNDAYFALHKWLVSKGIRNLDDIYVTKEQLEAFVKETTGSSRGNLPSGALWGQTREVLKGIGKLKKKK